MPVIAEDPVERLNRKAFSFHVGEFHSFSTACLNVEVDVKLRVWNHYTNGSIGLEKPVKIPHNVGRHRFLQVLKAMLAVYALETVIGKRDSLSYVPAQVNSRHPQVIEIDETIKEVRAAADVEILLLFDSPKLTSSSSEDLSAQDANLGIVRKRPAEADLSMREIHLGNSATGALGSSLRRRTVSGPTNSRNCTAVQPSVSSFGIFFF